MILIKGKGNWLKDGRFIRGGRDEKRVYACGRQGGVAGKLVADVSGSSAGEWQSLENGS